MYCNNLKIFIFHPKKLKCVSFLLRAPFFLVVRNQSFLTVSLFFNIFQTKIIFYVYVSQFVHEDECYLFLKRYQERNEIYAEKHFQVRHLSSSILYCNVLFLFVHFKRKKRVLLGSVR